VAASIRANEKSKDLIGNQTRDLFSIIPYHGFYVQLARLVMQVQPHKHCINAEQNRWSSRRVLVSFIAPSSLSYCSLEQGSCIETMMDHTPMNNESLRGGGGERGGSAGATFHSTTYSRTINAAGVDCKKLWPTADSAVSFLAR
jgi:hypothetical protein